MKLAEEILKKLEAKTKAAKKSAKLAEMERDVTEAEYYLAHEAKFRAAIDGSENYDELSIKEAQLSGALQVKENWAHYRDGELAGLKWALDIVRECVNHEKRRAAMEADAKRFWEELTA